MDELTDREQLVFDEIHRLVEERMKVDSLRKAYMAAEGDDNLWRYSEYHNAEVAFQQSVISFAKYSVKAEKIVTP